MAKSIPALAILLMFTAIATLRSAHDFSLWLSIDCGSSLDMWDPTISVTWVGDDEYVKEGESKFIQGNQVLSMLSMNTLRSFPKGVINCYYIPLELPGKYLLRAGFYYANYDNISQPPTFDLEINGNILVTVDTSLGDEPIFHEVMFATQKKLLPVCLIQTQNGQVPFISSIETASIHEEVYAFMSNDTALHLESRINYGANSSILEPFDRLDDKYNRVWEPKQLPDYQDVTSGIIQAEADNCPPFEVLHYAIEANNINESIFLPITFHQKTQLSAYFVFYIVGSDKYPPANETRKVAVYINGEEKNVTEIHGTYVCKVVTVYPVNVTGTANVTISPAEGTTIPAMINAMEVFSRINVSSPVSRAEYVLPLSSMPLVLVCFLGVFPWF